MKPWILLLGLLWASVAHAQSQLTAIPNLHDYTPPINANDLFILYQPANAGVKTVKVPASAVGFVSGAPIITGCTGLFSGSCALAAGSTNTTGEISINNGAGLGSGTGTITLGFTVALGTHGSSCAFTLGNNGAFVWPSASIAAAGARSTTSQQIQWIYGIGVNFPASVTLMIEYLCRGY